MRKILLGVACIVALAPTAEGAVTPFLDFPLSCPIAAQGKCSTTRYSKGAYAPASMASVLDHHMEKPYDEDGIVTAFTGEEGRATATKPKANQGCYPQYSPNPGKPFIIKGLYQGTNDGCLAEQGLNYDNHPAYDYIAEVSTPVYAAASGKVVKIINKVTGFPGRCVPKGIDTSGCGVWGYVGIDHGNGYITQYGHLSRIDFVSGDEIKAGALIGLTGQSSPPAKDKNGNVIARYSVAPHFHFEVLKESKGSPYGYAFVDPYGWEGDPKNDPLEKATGIPNVRLWKTNATAASAGPNAAQTTPTTTPPVTVANMTLSDRLRGSPAYRRSFNALFAATPPTDRWLSRFLSGGGSVESPGSACDIGGSTYGYFNACEPHNCGANQIDVFFDANGSRAWARHVNHDSGSSRFYGNPDRAMVSAFEVAERRRRSGILTPCEITPRPPASAGPNAAQTTSTATPHGNKALVGPQKWEREWKGTQQRGKATDPIIMRLRRDDDKLEGLVIHPSYKWDVPAEVRGLIKSDGEFRLTSNGGLLWYGKISAEDSISGKFPNGDPNDPNIPKFPFGLSLVKALPEGSIRTTRDEGPPTTSDWQNFIGAFRLAIQQQNETSLKPMIARRIYVGNESCTPNEALNRVRKGGWREIAKVLANSPKKLSPSPWGRSRFLIVDEQPCPDCRYKVALAFEQDDNLQWHWTEFSFPGD